MEAPCCGRILATPAEFSRQVRQSLPWGEAVQGCWHTWDGAGSGDTAGALVSGAGHPRCAPRRWVNPPRSMGRTSKPAPLRTPDCSHLSHPIPSEAAGGVGTSRAGAGRWWGSRGGGGELISPAHPSSPLDAVPEISLSFQTLFLPGNSRFNLSDSTSGGSGPAAGSGGVQTASSLQRETAKQIPCTEDAWC